MTPHQARRRFAAARVARLATVDAVGRPHIVPVTFAVDGDVVFSAVDAQPKRGTALKRLANVAANPLRRRLEPTVVGTRRRHRPRG